MVIEGREAAQAFERTKSRRILLELVAGERSAQELADRTGLSPSLLHHYLGRLLRLGLIAIVGETKRAGRSIRRYRAVAREFLVPSHLDMPGPSRALAAELAAALRDSRARQPDSGILYFVEDGRPRILRLGDDSFAEGFEIWSRLGLTPVQARSLADELRSVLRRYEPGARPGSGARRHLAYFAMARTS